MTLLGRRLVPLAIVAVCLVFLLAPFPGDERFVDQRIYRQATEQMRDGADYYDAMDAALRANTGPAESVRAFRTPTVFLLWRLAPSQFAVWMLFVIAVGAVGVLLARVADTPAAPVAFVLYALHLARPVRDSGTVDQFLIVELWALVAGGAALACWRLRRDALAAASATVATLIRELAAGVVIGGLAAAHLAKRARRPWLVGAGVVALALFAHAAATESHLVDEGTEIALWGTGGPSRVIDMLAWSLPAPWVVGPLVWALAWYRAAADRGELVFLAPSLLFPIVGLFVGRTYWGFLVSPLLVFLAADGAVRLVARAHRSITNLAWRPA